MDKTVDLSSQELTEIPDSIVFSHQTEKLILDFNDIVVFPPELCQKLLHLSYISANGNMLECLPNEMGVLKELSELYLKENCLLSLPESLSELHNLTKLHITGNQIQELPEGLGSLRNVSELIANENLITRLPCDFGNLCCLTYLDLSHNSIQALPSSFGNLRNLKELDLSNNCLKDLPDSFKCLPTLEVVDLTNNEIKILPSEFLSSKTIKKFLMNENSVTGLPEWLSESENLQEMCFSANDLLEVPFSEEFGIHNTSLKWIDLSGNNITTLFEGFGKLKSLEHLDMGSSFDELERNRFLANGNNLKYLPDSFTDLHNLVKLELDENELCELPTDFGFLTNLTYLDLGHNDLLKLPDSFCLLKNLKICLLSMNFITELPLEFGMLSVVEDLKLDNNLLSELPPSFKDLSTLTALDLYNNRLKEIPKALSELKYLKHLDLRENDFGLPLDEVPDITYEPTYLARKTEHHNNWRGRERPDIDPSSWVETKAETENKSKLSDDIAYPALTSSSSLWRKHGQSDMRQKSVMNRTQSQSLNLSGESEHSENDINTSCNGLNNSFTDADEPECWDEDIYQKLCSQNKNLESADLPVNFDIEDQSDCDNFSNTSGSDSDPGEKYREDLSDLSDWDSDSCYETPNNFKRTYRHPTADVKPDMHVFVPSDLHVSRIKVQEVWQTYEDGQFDDADL